MRLCLVFFYISMLCNVDGFSQDLAFYNDGKEDSIIVKRIKSDIIEFVKYNNPDGPIYEVSKCDIFKIKYKNGTQELFKPCKDSELIPVTNYSGKNIDVKSNEKSNTNDVKIEIKDLFNVQKDTNNLNSNKSNSNNDNTTKNESSATDENCIKNLTGDIKFINKSKYPLTLFLYVKGQYLKTIDVSLKNSTIAYNLIEGNYSYSMKPSNVGQIDPATNKPIEYFSINGEFYVKKCQVREVILQ